MTLSWRACDEADSSGGFLLFHIHVSKSSSNPRSQFHCLSSSGSKKPAKKRAVRMDVGPANKEDAEMPLVHSLWGQRPSTEVLRHPLQAAACLLVGHSRTSIQTNKQVSPSGQHGTKGWLLQRGTDEGEDLKVYFFLWVWASL